MYFALPESGRRGRRGGVRTRALVPFVRSSVRSVYAPPTRLFHYVPEKEFMNEEDAKDSFREPTPSLLPPRPLRLLPDVYRFPSLPCRRRRRAAGTQRSRNNRRMDHRGALCCVKSRLNSRAARIYEYQAPASARRLSSFSS